MSLQSAINKTLTSGAGAVAYKKNILEKQKQASERESLKRAKSIKKQNYNKAIKEEALKRVENEIAVKLITPQPLSKRKTLVWDKEKQQWRT